MQWPWLALLFRRRWGGAQQLQGLPGVRGLSSGALRPRKVTGSWCAPGRTRGRVPPHLCAFSTESPRSPLNPPTLPRDPRFKICAVLSSELSQNEINRNLQTKNNRQDGVVIVGPLSLPGLNSAAFKCTSVSRETCFFPPSAPAHQERVLLCRSSNPPPAPHPAGLQILGCSSFPPQAAPPVSPGSICSLCPPLQRPEALGFAAGTLCPPWLS